MSPSFGLHHVRVEKCRIAGRLRLVVRHVSNGIPGTQVAIRRYFAAQRTTAEEVDSRSPWHHQNPKDAENGHPAELHPTAQVDPKQTLGISSADFALCPKSGLHHREESTWMDRRTN
jgi:hypothetical protein